MREASGCAFPLLHRYWFLLVPLLTDTEGQVTAWALPEAAAGHGEQEDNVGVLEDEHLGLKQGRALIYWG